MRMFVVLWVSPMPTNAPKKNRHDTRSLWVVQARDYLKRELGEQKVAYSVLAAKLSTIYPIAESELARLIDSGTCPVWLWLMILDVLKLKQTVSKK